MYDIVSDVTCPNSHPYYDFSFSPVMKKNLLWEKSPSNKKKPNSLILCLKIPFCSAL